MKTALFAITLLAGCTSYAERQAKPPDFEAMTVRTPDDYISCAAPKILALRGNARVMPDGQSRVLILGNAMNTGVTLTASPTSGGSMITLRMSFGQAFSEAWPLAKSCL